MSMPIRSRRETGLDAKNTPDVVGPGAYLGHGFYYVPESDVAFSTTVDRGLITNNEEAPGGKAFGDDSPGPGTYSTAKSSLKSAPLGKPLLAGQAPRFGPVAPGQSGYCESSVLEVPGPGQYSIETKWIKYRRSMTAKGNPDTEIPIEEMLENPTEHHPTESLRGNKISLRLLGVDGTPPAIPGTKQSYGYEQTEEGKMRVQTAPHKVHTGVGSDRVGPGEYDISDSLYQTNKSTNFSRSKTRRDVFSLTSFVPGPGTYEPSKVITNAAAANNVCTSSFASKVPMAHEIKDSYASETPGPGSYSNYDGKNQEKNLHRETLKEAETDMYESAHRPRTEESMRNYAMPGAFGSGTTRPPPSDHEMQTPYLAPSRTHTPGPGTYGRTRRTWLSLYDQHESRVNLSRGKEHVGFSSTSMRDCLREDAKDFKQPPGPGSYSPSLAMSTKAAAKKCGDSVFGSTAPRRSMFDLCNADIGPGPGDYNPDIDLNGIVITEYAAKMKQLHGPTQGEVNFLMDEGNEFETKEDIAAARNIRKLQKKQLSSVFRGGAKRTVNSDSNTPAFYVIGNEDKNVTVKMKKKKNRKPAVFNSSSAGRGGGGFASSSQRFDRYSAFGNQSKGPGPGSYKIRGDKATKRPSYNANPKYSKMSGAIRFEGPNTIYDRPASKIAGPGSYDVQGSMVKKSYNVTMRSDRKARRESRKINPADARVEKLFISGEN